MLVYTNTAYRPLSRNRKKLPKKPRKAKPAWTPYVPSSKVFRPDTPEYPSRTSLVGNCEKTNDDYKKEISKNYPVAPAYNKGAYQVISNTNIEDIGK